MKKNHKYVYHGSYNYCPVIGEKKTKVPNITEAMKKQQQQLKETRPQ